MSRSWSVLSRLAFNNQILLFRVQSEIQSDKHQKKKEKKIHKFICRIWYYGVNEIYHIWHLNKLNGEYISLTTTAKTTNEIEIEFKRNSLLLLIIIIIRDDVRISHVFVVEIA